MDSDSKPTQTRKPRHRLPLNLLTPEESEVLRRSLASANKRLDELLAEREKKE